MLRNYLLVAARTLFRQQGYTAINLGGLAIGLASCVLITLYLQHETSFDRFHEKADEIFRVAVDLETSAGVRPLAQAAPPVGPNLEEEFPEILTAVRFASARGLVSRPDAHATQFQEDNGFYADGSVFSVFDFRLISGDARSALAGPGRIVLTKAMATRYFGDEDPLGNPLILDHAMPLEVGGVIEEVPGTAHFRFDFLLSMPTLLDRRQALTGDWGAFFFPTFVLMQAGTAPGALDAKLHDFMVRHTESDEPYRLVLEPLTSIYLGEQRLGHPGSYGDPGALRTFSLIAVFILLIACVNFTNLATARAADRAREVGMRKVVGARRRQVVTQFLGESILLSMVAVAIAALLASAALPAFEWLSGKELSADVLTTPASLLILGGTALIVGLAAGAYPALVLSGFRPRDIIKGQFLTSAKGLRLRRGLVVLQFGISLALVVGTAVVFSQLRYMTHRDLGYSHEQLLVVRFNGDEQVRNDQQALKELMSTHPAVRGATFSNRIPGGRNLNAGISVENRDGDMQGSIMYHYLVDYDFLDTYGIEMVAGRALSEEFGTDDTAAILLNQAAAEHLGYSVPDQAVGVPYVYTESGRVVGVVTDFHVESLRDAVHPMAIHIAPESASYLTLRVSTDNVSSTLSELEALWSGAVPHRPFDSRFLDEAFAQQYEAERVFGRVFAALAGLAILIACLGLFGLAAFTVQRRAREIGVRKVLGASSGQIVYLLSREVGILIGIAIAVASPVAYLFMSRWLEGFAFRTELSWEVFVLGGGLVAGIALATVGLQSWRAASSEPVKAIRSR